jgi:hypothetical protein
LQQGPKREAIVLVTREARQVEDDDELDGALVLAAELKQVLQLLWVFALGT